MTPRLLTSACLSLTGRFAQFGRQAEQGLRLWADYAGVHLAVMDDKSDPAVLADRLAMTAPNVDLLFGPYSTVLTRAAVTVAEEHGALLFNHGGSGGHLDRPGRVVNILTPASRYAHPFIQHVAQAGVTVLHTVRGPGRFGRDVIEGAEHAARDAGILTPPLNLDDPPNGVWDLISAGVYEDDIATVRHALTLPNPPRTICSVAAGVASFAHDLGTDPDGIYGVGQWAPGGTGDVEVGMDEREFLTAWRDRYGTTPDYPGVQAYAAGLIAEAAVRTAGTTEPRALWQTLSGLDFTTVFGTFRIHPETGEQVGHQAVLTQWRDGVQIRA